MKHIFGFLLLVLQLAYVRSHDMDIYCLKGITTAITAFKFKADPTAPRAKGKNASRYNTICTNKLGVTSIWAAAKLYCSPDEIDAGYASLNSDCQSAKVEMVPYSEVLPQLTEDFVHSLPVVEFSDTENKKKWETPILLSRELFTTGYRSIYNVDAEGWTDTRYGFAMYGFWGGVVLIGMVNRLLTLPSRRATVLGDEEASTTGAPSRQWGPFSALMGLVQTYLVIPAALGTHHQRLYHGCRIPTRLETVVVAAFYILTIILCGVSYNVFWPNLKWPETEQAYRYIANRTGILAVSLLPVLWVFAGRNNIFIWATGWKFSTFNVFHRHIARAVTLLIVAHALCYSVVHSSELASYWRLKYWDLGAMALISMGFMVTLSINYLRRKSYEVFLIIHIVLAAVVIAGVRYHVEIFDGEFNGFVWATVAAWSLDRFLRLLRLVYCNIHLKLAHGLVGTTATATYNKEAGLIRLEVVPQSRLAKPGAGQHFFLYQPLRWKGWENHPFTLASWEDEQADATPGGVHDKEMQVASSSSSSEGVVLSTPSPCSPGQGAASVAKARQKLVFLMRPCSGWTQRLSQDCLASPDGVSHPRILVEGPYGGRGHIHTYQDVIMIAGGSGITLPLSHLRDFLSCVGTNAKSRTNIRNITLAWTTKESAMIYDVADREMRHMLGRDDIRVRFYVTSAKESVQNVDALHSDMLEKIPSVRSRMTSSEPSISYGRPDITSIIQEAGSAASNTAILVCGPASMADATRAAVYEARKLGKKFEYVEECFGW